nr:agmatine deiminase [Candidatus Cloacimonadota bacterium]
MKFRHCIILMIMSLIFGFSLAETVNRDDGAFDDIILQRFTQTPAPLAPVRAIAEFEPASAALIRYPLGIPTSLVVELANTVDVICLVGSNSQLNNASNSFTSAGVNMDRVSFMIASTDSYWTRDYGPLFVYDGEGEYSIVDFLYNRPRPNDNMIPELFAAEFDLPYFGMDLYQTGGNYMTDGLGTAVQSHIAYTENGNDQAHVDNRMLEYLGISNYHVVQDPNNTYIDHVDCWGKFLSPDKILIRRVPSNHPQYTSLEATANYFANQISAWGYPYRVYRVDTPQDQPYTNSLILNKRVFVPVMNSPWDDDALQAYQEAMPGYDIVPVNGSYYEPWQSTDALHCRVHEIPDPDMLHIAHMPYYGNQDFAEEYVLLADIVDNSSSGLIIDSLYVAYQINSTDWQMSSLNSLDNDSYIGYISGYAPGDTIRYFINAADQSGRHRTHPDFAAADPHIFVVEGDASPPQLTHFPIESISDDEVTFTVSTEDESQITQVELEYRVDDSNIISNIMINAGNGIYIYSLYPNFDDDAKNFFYRITAEDSYGNVAHLPVDAPWYSVPIIPVGITDDIQSPPLLTLSVYPNPLRRSDKLKLDFDGAEPGRSRLTIYNIRGQLIYEQDMHASKGILEWNGRDNRGQNTTNGIYFLRIESGGRVANCKLIIAK